MRDALSIEEPPGSGGTQEGVARKEVHPAGARFLVGPRHARLLPVCALMGAVFLVLADVGSRVLVPNQVLPIGVVTALVGAPGFALILIRGRRIR